MRFVSTAALTIASTAAASLACAQDFNFPQRKSGQWEIKMVTQPSEAPPDMSMTACVDSASNAEMMRAGLSMPKEMCPQEDVKREGDAYVIDATCKMGPMESRLHSVITGDSQSAYAVETTTETTGGLAAMAGTNVFTQEGRWVSAECGNGLQPGEMLMPGGMKTNINEIMKMMSGG